MQLITKAIERQLIANWHNHGSPTAENKPPLKLFSTWGAATWLISEMNGDDNDLLFGLCDLGMGSPELGYVSHQELRNIKGPMGLTIERDMLFQPEKSLLDYAQEAAEQGAVTA